MKTINDYEKELERVENALSSTKSIKLRNDFLKYRKKLIKEINFYKNNFKKGIKMKNLSKGVNN